MPVEGSQGGVQVCRVRPCCMSSPLYFPTLVVTPTPPRATIVLARRNPISNTSATLEPWRSAAQTAVVSWSGA